MFSQQLLFFRKMCSSSIHVILSSLSINWSLSVTYDLSESFPDFSNQNAKLPPAHLEETSKEVYLSRGCDRTELLLSCPKSTMLLIVSASFSPSLEYKLNCTDFSLHSEQITAEHANNQILRGVAKDLRQTLNRRCSGYIDEKCKFSLLLDQPVARSWGEGLVEVRHKCVSLEKISDKCGRVNVGVRETTVIMSKSYPKYYIGRHICTWYITVPQPQMLLLRVLDLQLRGFKSHKGKCDDRFIIDRDTVLCGEMGEQVYVVSQTGRFIVHLITGPGYVQPMRGVIFEIIPIGCDPYFPSSSDSFLVHHNKTHALYQCQGHRIFSTTLSTTYALICIGHSYHSQLPPCVSVNHLLAHGNTSVVQALLSRNNTMKKHLDSHWLEEAFLPLFFASMILILSLGGLMIFLFMKKHLMVEQFL